MQERADPPEGVWRDRPRSAAAGEGTPWRSDPQRGVAPRAGRTPRLERAPCTPLFDSLLVPALAFSNCSCRPYAAQRLTSAAAAQPLRFRFRRNRSRAAVALEAMVS